MDLECLFSYWIGFAGEKRALQSTLFGVGNGEIAGARTC